MPPSAFLIDNFRCFLLWILYLLVITLIQLCYSASCVHFNIDPSSVSVFVPASQPQQFSFPSRLQFLVLFSPLCPSVFHFQVIKFFSVFVLCVPSSFLFSSPLTSASLLFSHAPLTFMSFSFSFSCGHILQRFCITCSSFLSSSCSSLQLSDSLALEFPVFYFCVFLSVSCPLMCSVHLFLFFSVSGVSISPFLTLIASWSSLYFSLQTAKHSSPCLSFLCSSKFHIHIPLFRNSGQHGSLFFLFICSP